MENHLLKYQVFVRTVECGSFTRAAEELHYAQSSVSKMIGDLEREWGVTLLERSRGGVMLTSAGWELLPRARAILNEHRELEGYIHQLGGVQTGVVRIGTFASVAIHWLPNIIAEFQKDYPGVDYELLLGDYEQVAQWITDGRVDCGFLPRTVGFDLLVLQKDEYKVALPPEHPLAAAGSRSH